MNGDEFEELHELALDYRIKSVQSAILKCQKEKLKMMDIEESMCIFN